MFIVQKTVKQARRLVGKRVIRRLVAEKRLAKRRNRRIQKQRLRLTGAEFEFHPVVWTAWQII